MLKQIKTKFALVIERIGLLSFFKKNLSFNKQNLSFPFGLLVASLTRAESEKRKLRIIQIGANDGIKGDPLHDFLVLYGKFVNILFVEPQIQLKDELKKNTENFVNQAFYKFCGISEKRGDLDLFTPNQKIYPKSSGITSFDRKQVEKRLVRFWGCKPPAVEGRDYHKITVPSVPLKDLKLLPYVKEGDPIADILFLDCEGLDDKVIMSIGDVSLLPDLISFEHKNLEIQSLDNLINWLENSGFSVLKWGKSDTLAFRIDMNSI